MTKRHTITHADELYRGDAFKDAYSPDGRRGILMSHLHHHRFLTTAGAAPAAGNGVDIFSSYATPSLLSSSGGNWVSAATGTAQTAGATIINFDVPRNILIRTSGATGNILVKVHGLDAYGDAMAETISVTGGGNVFTSGQRAFKSITKIYCTTALAAGNVLSIGRGNRLGLPFHLDNVDRVVAVTVDGKGYSTGATGYTVFAGVSLATTLTTTEGDADARGTIKFGDPAPNGTRRLACCFEVVADSLTKGFGLPQVSSCTNG